MRKTLALATALALTGLAVPGAQAPTDTGSQAYFATSGAQADDFFLALSWCVLSNVDPALTDQFGCLGGGDIYTSEAEALGCGQGACDAIKYLVMTLTITDAATGPNVYGTVCNFNPNGGNICPGDVPDGYLDAAARGCGVALTADASTIAGHTGNHRAAGFAYTLGVDSTTTAVCVGTNGVMNVLFS